MPRLLVLANRLPYPIDDGWKTRVFHLLRAAVRVHETDLVTFEGESPEHAQTLTAMFDGRLRIHEVPAPAFRRPRALLSGLLTTTPYHTASQWSDAYAATVSRLVASQDVRVAVAAGFHYSRYLDLVPTARRIVDSHNVDSANVARYAEQLSGFARFYTTQTVPKLARIESMSLERYDEVWVCSREDAERLHGSRAHRADIPVIPNGVDIERFALRTVAPQESTFIFFGRLDYFPNEDAIAFLSEAILPRIPDDVTLKVRIVGAGASPAVLRAARECGRMHYVGRVDDIAAEIANAPASLAPLRAGGGTRLKLLESLAVGTPAITTSIGAEGLLPDIHEGVWLADDATQFANAMLDAIRDPSAAIARGQRGRAAVSERFSWGALTNLMTNRLAALAAA